MSDFKLPKVQEESDPFKRSQIVKSDHVFTPTISEFHFSDLKEDRSAPVSYEGEVSDQQNDHRFMLSQLARDAMAIGKVEERLIETQVNERLAELSEKTREEAFREGFNDGQKKGQDEAFQKFKSECEERIRQVSALISSMENAKSEIFEANRDFMIEMIYRISKTVLLREVATDKEYLIRLARELIEKTGLRENLIVKIHPNDAAAVDRLKEGIMKSFEGLKNLSIELSDHVNQGGCVLETEWGATDASLETQLVQVLDALGKGLNS